MFAVSPDIEDFNYNFELDNKNSKIICGNCKKAVGFIIEDNMDLLRHYQDFQNYKNRYYRINYFKFIFNIKI